MAYLYTYCNLELDKKTKKFLDKHKQSTKVVNTFSTKRNTNHPKQSSWLVSSDVVRDQLESLMSIDYLHNGHCTKQEKNYFTYFSRCMRQLWNSYLSWRGLNMDIGQPRNHYAQVLLNLYFNPCLVHNSEQYNEQVFSFFLILPSVIQSSPQKHTHQKWFNSFGKHPLWVFAQIPNFVFVFSLFIFFNF